MIVRRALISAFATVGLGGILAAQVPVLDLKLGLWENTASEGRRRLTPAR